MVRTLRSDMVVVWGGVKVVVVGFEWGVGSERGEYRLSRRLSAIDDRLRRATCSL